MRVNAFKKESIEEALRPFRHLVGPNEWLNFAEMALLIRLSESISEAKARTAFILLSETDGIIQEEKGKLTVTQIFGGYVLDRAC